ncbi:major facilitator superfamily domain-containing protein [Aspergillus varians]
MSDAEVENGVEKTPNAPVDEDYEPRNATNVTTWSLASKIYHTAIPCFLAFLITFSSSVTAPAASTLMAEFNINRTEVILEQTLYMLGLSFGPLIMAPLSEFVGRRWLYLATSSSIIAFAGGSGAARNFATLLICRFLCGFLGSAGVAIGAGTLLDVWGLTQAGGLARLLFICGPFLGPAMGPLAGAYVIHEHNGDWRWTQWTVALIGAPIWILILFMKETADFQVDRGTKYPGCFGIVQLTLSTLKAAVLRSVTMLTTEPIALSLTLYTGYAYAVMFSFFASSSYTYSLDYGFNRRQIGLSFISVIIGYFLAAVMHLIFELTLYARAVRQAPDGLPAPEHRLYSAMAGSIFLPIGLFWYAWEAHPGGHWAAVMASGIPFGLGAFVLFLSSIIYLVESYGAGAAASALAANGSIRYLLGAVFPLFTIQMYERLGVHWAGSVFGFLSLALLPIPWMLFKFGHVLRKKSRFISST